MNYKSTHVPFLDLARGFAILIVFIFHCLPHGYGLAELPWNGWFRDFDVPRPFLALLPFTFGEAGVAIFFVVSGFCIHQSHARSGKKDFRDFFKRRFFRIYPPYLFALLVFAFVYPFRFISQYDSSSGWTQLISHLVLIHNFHQDTIWGINPVFWSIAVEVQLYCLYPLLMFIVSKSGWRTALVTTGIIEIAIRGMGAAHYFISNDPLPLWFLLSPFACLFSWSIGAALADRYLQGKPFPLSKHPIGLWLGVAVASYFFRPLSSFSFLLFAVLTAVVLSHVLQGNVRRTETRWGQQLSTHLQFVGSVSYSLYLIHLPILHLVPITLQKFYSETTFHPMIRFVLCVAIWPIVLTLSWIMYKTVEIPSIKAGKLFKPAIANSRF